MATVDLSIQSDISLGLCVFVICLTVPMILITSFGNLVILITIYRKHRLSNTASNIFISSLALFDFLTGFIGLPVAIVGFLIRRQFLYRINCGIWYFAPCIVFVQVSVLNLVLITFDRFLAIKFPFRYCTWMSPEVAFRICVFLNVFGTIIGSLSFIVTGVASIFVPPPNITYEYDCGQSPMYEYYGAPTYVYVINPLAGLTIPTMFIVYVYVFLIASNQAKVAATRTGTKVITREMKVTKTTATILVVYTLCIAPTALKAFVQSYIDNGYTWLVWYPWFSDYMSVANSMVNPFIYAGRSKLMRQEFKETMHFITHKVFFKIHGNRTKVKTISVKPTSIIT
ncbi:adenosine receptor A2a-like [Antedon mediterranea]|uniref:adenosine receptor A2a-like n=1 Tax=Antedon mediterranea TaxID=105859 RepID=UPI003AF753B5